MNKIVFFFSLLVSSLFPVTSSGNSQGSAVAELRYQGGFASSGTPFVRGVRILEDGQAISFAEPEETRDLIATMASDKLHDFVALVDSIGKKPLVDDSEGQPECADGPNVFYTVTNSKNETVTIAKEINCHRYTVHQYGVETINDILKTFSVLGALNRRK